MELILLGLLYMLPTLFAIARKNRIGMVIAVNIFLGWTIIGWFAAFRMAFDGGRPATGYSDLDKLYRRGGRLHLQLESGETIGFPVPKWRRQDFALPGNVPASWGTWPKPHYDSEGNCQCPDHVAMRRMVRIDA